MFMYIAVSNHWAQSRLGKGIWRWLAGEDIFMLEMCCPPVCRVGRMRWESKAWQDERFHPHRCEPPICLGL